MTKTKGTKGIDTPLKAQISRHYQKLGGDGVRGAASATAREFKLGGSGAAARVKKYDAEVAAGIASRTNRRSSGRPLGFNEAVEAEIDAVFEANDTTTYHEAADQCGIATLDVKILRAFEMRKDCAQESIETDGWCPQEGKGKGGAHRVHVDASYAQLRARLGIADS